jgi:putative endonuclease
LVECLLWEQDVVSSSLATPTQKETDFHLSITDFQSECEKRGSVFLIWYFWVSERSRSSVGYLPAVAHGRCSGRQGAALFNTQMIYVYVLISEAKGAVRLYIGMSENVEKRLEEHNSGKTKSTRNFVPWQLFKKEKFENRVAARKREKELKQGSFRERLKQNWINIKIP